MRLLILALLVTACGASKPTKLQMAEAACNLEMQGVIESGACDKYEELSNCPAAILTEAQCYHMLKQAAGEMKNEVGGSD